MNRMNTKNALCIVYWVFNFASHKRIRVLLLLEDTQAGLRAKVNLLAAI